MSRDWSSRLDELLRLPADDEFAAVQPETEARVRALLSGFEPAGISTDTIRIYATHSGSIEIDACLGAVRLSARFGPNGDPSIGWTDLGGDYSGELEKVT